LYWQSQCAEQEGQIAHLTASVEELTQARVQQARQLAKARQRAHVSTEQERNGGEGGREEREMAERLKRELKVAQCELERAKEREQQVSAGSGSEVMSHSRRSPWSQPLHFMYD